MFPLRFWQIQKCPNQFKKVYICPNSQKPCSNPGKILAQILDKLAQFLSRNFLKSAHPQMNSLYQNILDIFKKSFLSNSDLPFFTNTSSL